MKKFKKFASALFASVFVMSLFLAPVATANAMQYEHGLLVVYTNHAFARTQWPGHVDVGLVIHYMDVDTGMTYDAGDMASSDYGFVEVTLQTGSTSKVITSAISYHGKYGKTVGIKWDPLNGYVPIP